MNRGQMIAAFDLDGTLLKKNSSFAFCRFLAQRAFLSKSDLLFCAYTYFRHCYLGLSLWDLHQKVFERCFYGSSLTTLNAFIEPFLVDTLQKFWYLPAVARLQSLQQRGVECVILSNSPSFLVEPIAKKIGIKKIFATEYRLNEKGEFVTLSSLMDGAQKAKVLRGFELAEIVAFSDSHLDLPFLESAHIAIAVNPKRRLKKIAQEKGWEIL